MKVLADFSTLFRIAVTCLLLGFVAGAVVACSLAAGAGGEPSGTVTSAGVNPGNEAAP